MGRKYLFVINSFLAGGAERSLVELLPRLASKGVTPMIVCLRRRDVGFEDEVREAGFDVRLLPGHGRLAKILALRRIIREETPDLVYTSLFDADITGRLAAVGLDVTVVSNLANTAYDEARMADPNLNEVKLNAVRWVDGFTARHLTDHFHAVSQAVKDSTVDSLGVDPERITVVRRGRDVERLGERSPERVAEARRQLGLEADVSLVVTVGRQEYQKGHKYLLDAFAGVVADRPRTRLMIAGREGHATAQLAAQVSSLDLQDSVQFLGHRPDVPEILAAADLFVFPSLYEGLGGALIEALALELPIVASDLPAIREVVEEGGDADLVPPADPEALRAAIVSLLDDPERRERYGERSRELFLTHFQADRATEEMVTLLERLAAG